MSLCVFQSYYCPIATHSSACPEEAALLRQRSLTSCIVNAMTTETLGERSSPPPSPGKKPCLTAVKTYRQTP